MAISRLAYLFNIYVQQQCSVAEEEELMVLIADPENRELVEHLIGEVVSTTGDEIAVPDHQSASILNRILHFDRTPVVPMKKKHVHWFSRSTVVAAAVLVFFMTGAIYWYFEKKPNRLVEKMAAYPAVIVPGGDRAMLTVADGTVIVLDSVQNGLLSQQENTNINKQGASLVYTANSSANTKQTLFNTLSTPRGGQFHLTLPDGSNVWLNSASSLRYPVAFTGDLREVELMGEAYFEIADNKKKPFRVRVGDMKVEVLGTHFNINAYKDEGAIRTSLLEGQVKIVKGKSTDILQPGQQAVFDIASDQFKKINVDVDVVVAWKNGLFQFDGDDITGIMRQIDRWYDVEVVYPGKVPVRHFEGKISRSAQLSDVLHILKLSGVEFNVKGKEIIVQ